MKGKPLGESFNGRGKALAGATVAAAALTLTAVPAEAKDSLLVKNTRAKGNGSFAMAVKKASKGNDLDTIRFKNGLRGRIQIRKDMEIPSGLRVLGNGYGRGKGAGRVVLRGPERGVTLTFTKGRTHKLDDLSLERVALRGEFPAGVLKITRSTVSGDATVDGVGASIGPDFRYGEAEMAISDSTIEGFEYGVTASDASARISRSLIRDNVGGGGVVSGAYSDIDVYNSTISGNQLNATDGFPLGGAGVRGGYYSGADLFNSTVTGNSVIGPQGYGGAVAYSVEVYESTLVGNSAATGGAVGAPYSTPAISGAGEVVLSNSIVFGNTATDPAGAPDCEGGQFITSRGGNVIGELGDCGSQPTDLIGVDPLLGPLQDNGGPTPTMALAEGSPAIGLAVERFATERDQRGVERGGDPDSGAYERR